MNIRMDNLLPLAEIDIKYLDYQAKMNRVLIDTGCAVTVFDTDAAAEAGIYMNPNFGMISDMYGIGGGREYTYEQTIHEVAIDAYTLYDFSFQLTDLRTAYGFDAVLGADFLRQTNFVIDFGKIS